MTSSPGEAECADDCTQLTAWYCRGKAPGAKPCQNRSLSFSIATVCLSISEPISLSVLIDVIAEAGGEFDTQSAHDRFLGRSMASVVEMLRDEHGVSLGHSALEDMRHRLYEKFRKELEPITGIAEAVAKLPMRYCVASSSQIERIELSLEITGLLPLFKGRIFSSSMVSIGKPAPDLFLHAARALGVAPSRCIVIEDFASRRARAKAAGMTVFAFTGGGHATGNAHRAALERAGPDRIFSDMRRSAIAARDRQQQSRDTRC